jgi:hypothetical protein
LKHLPETFFEKLLRQDPGLARARAGRRAANDHAAVSDSISLKVRLSPSSFFCISFGVRAPANKKPAFLIFEGPFCAITVVGATIGIRIEIAVIGIVVFSGPPLLRI